MKNLALVFWASLGVISAVSPVPVSAQITQNGVTVTAQTSRFPRATPTTLDEHKTRDGVKVKQRHIPETPKQAEDKKFRGLEKVLFEYEGYDRSYYNLQRCLSEKSDEKAREKISSALRKMKEHQQEFTRLLGGKGFSITYKKNLLQEEIEQMLIVFQSVQQHCSDVFQAPKILPFSGSLQELLDEGEAYREVHGYLLGCWSSLASPEKTHVRKGLNEIEDILANHSLHAEFKAGTSLEGVRNLLPPAFSQLSGRLNASLRLNGTLDHPELDVQFSSPLIETDFAQARALQVSILHHTQGSKAGLQFQMSSKIASSSGQDVGNIDIQANTPLVIDLSDAKTFAPSVLRRAAVELHMASKLDMGRLAREILGPKAILASGMLDISFDAQGNAEAPMAKLSISGRRLTTPTLTNAGVGLTVDYHNDLAALGFDLSLRDQMLIQAKGQIAFALSALLRGQDWHHLPVQLDLAFKDVDLAKMSLQPGAISGRLNGQVKLEGTMAHPRANFTLNGDKLRVREWQAGDLHVVANYRDGQRASGQLTLRQPQGDLKAMIDIPLAHDKPIAASLEARNLQIAYRSDPQAKNSVLRELTGNLSSDVHLRGTRENPLFSGGFHFMNGSVALSTDVWTYSGIEVDVRMDETGHLVARRIAATADTGKFELSGDAKFKGFKPMSGDFIASAQNFPIAAGTVGLWLNAKLQAHMEREDEILRATATVTDAMIHLPQIASATNKTLQDVKPLEDVVFIDKRAMLDMQQKASAAVKRVRQENTAEANRHPVSATLQVDAPGSLRLRGKELSMDAEAKVSIELRGPFALISGSARALGGRVELLGKRYEVDRALVRLNGTVPPNPDLSIQVSRRLRDATMIIEVSGTLQKPRVVFRSDPPVYSESQIIAIVVSGNDPSQAGGANRTLDQQVVGALSGFLVNQLKDQLSSKLPLDVVKVDLGGEGYDVYKQARIEVGKYILDNLYVSYVHQFGTESGSLRTNANEVRVEYRFLRDFVLDTIFGDAGVGSIDLYWSRRF